MYEPIRIKYNLKLFNTTAQLLIHFDAIDNREGQVFELASGCYYGYKIAYSISY